MVFPAADYYNKTGQRPGSARFTNYGTNTSARPQTAGQVSYRGATPLFSNTDFNPEPEYDEKAHSRPATGLVPTYVTMDKQVARFYAHFFEDRNWDREGPLGDITMEKEICRLVTIQYYLYDNEVQILEPRVSNTGTCNHPVCVFTCVSCFSGHFFLMIFIHFPSSQACPTEHFSKSTP
jgi:hypothetical protein